MLQAFVHCRLIHLFNFNGKANTKGCVMQGSSSTGYQHEDFTNGRRPYELDTGVTLNWMADKRKPNESSVHSAEGRTSGSRESVPALEVPLNISHCHEDELISWLQYPLEDSFDKNYCSEEPYPQGDKSNSDTVYNAFSNLTLREATYTWGVPGVPDTKKGEKILTANMAMAMGAQRAAGLLFQSGADTFNKVRTNAQPHAARNVDNHVTERTSGSASSIEKPGLSSQNVTRPNFSVFFRTGGVTGMSSEQVTCTQTESRIFKNVEQLSPASDTPMIVTEFPFMSLPQSRTTEGTGMDFPRLPSQHQVKLGTSEGFFIADGIESTAPAYATSKLEAKAIGLMEQAMVTSQHPRSLLSQSAPASISGLSSGGSAGSSGKRIRAEASASGLSSGAWAGSSGKRIRADAETKHPMSQEDLSFGSASTVITDMDSCRQSKLARCVSETNINLAGSQIAVSTTDLDSKALCRVQTGSGRTSVGSQLHENVGMGDAFKQYPSSAWCDSTSKSDTKAAAHSTKRKAPFSEKAEFECKVLRGGNLLQGLVIGAKGTEAADIQSLEREGGIMGKKGR
ncbi:hypothetical protein GOP47_0013435 [Adiantum capillus-veneris]|uniref:Uncharacterized protein n=1 Tax=Adiantum capillus-veneris TaxID=13818 RepID=A0A9D4ZDE4_ADICA|nr:hypothetical protein GOP47_0013435 [Adiantum capillus-veneris]